MAAYAALVSLEHIINNLQLHSRPPISLHKQQVHLLTQKITFLQEFLEVYNPNLPYSQDADPLESRIARAAYAAEDAIESHILDHFTNNDEEKMSSSSLYEALKKVIKDMALIEKEAMEIKENVVFRNQLHAKSTPPDSSYLTSSFSIAQKESSMVGVDDLLLEMKSKLTADARDLQTLPIVGMGGSGKTTLALNIYQDSLIKEHFDICAWATISHEYSIREILVQLLSKLVSDKPNNELSDGELGEILHKNMYSRKFMIILDDMWSIEAWDTVKRFLPNNKNGSRIVITTRLTTLALALPNSNSLGMKLLDDEDSWDLLSKTVFGEKDHPLELEEIGRKIGKSCKGLPLSIVVVGGLLAKSEQTREFWEHMEGNLNAIINLDDDERCLKTLYMSYKQLPIHLKPCFLYMGIYSEDHVICISKLVKLWVAEGFLKLISGKRPEDVARSYVKDLSDRNLILIHKVGSIGSIKECKVHDLLRDLCLREAKKEGLYTVCPRNAIEDRMSRIVISGSIPEIQDIESLSCAPVARSLILNLYDEALSPRILSPLILRLLRIVGLEIASYELLYNLRFFTFRVKDTEFPSLICLFWNLHALVVRGYDYKTMDVPNDIWYMSHIRHLCMNDFHLPDPPPDVQADDGIVLSNLQTLGRIRDFTCSEEVVKRIPNIRKLRLEYYYKVDDRFCLANLDRLEKLETLKCNIFKLKCLNINFPHSLKKLYIGISRSQHCWEDILDKIGALPLLQKLQLFGGSFRGRWETTDGLFRSLKFLYLGLCGGLQIWALEASQFPRLEQLHLFRADDLEEIPLDFAEISTLRVIDINKCSDSTVESAKRILEEQEALYGEEETTLQIQVALWRDNNPALESLRSPNFHVTFC